MKPAKELVGVCRAIYCQQLTQIILIFFVQYVIYNSGFFFGHYLSSQINSSVTLSDEFSVPHLSASAVRK